MKWEPHTLISDQKNPKACKGKCEGEKQNDVGEDLENVLYSNSQV